MLGYPSYADLSLVPKMAESPPQVLEFLEDLARRARPHAERDLAELEAFLARHPETDQAADDCSVLHRLVLGEIAVLQDGDVPILVLPDDECVDDANDVRFLELLELGERLAFELRILESENQHLHRTYAHVAPLLACA